MKNLVTLGLTIFALFTLVMVTNAQIMTREEAAVIARAVCDKIGLSGQPLRWQTTQELPTPVEVPEDDHDLQDTLALMGYNPQPTLYPYPLGSLSKVRVVYLGACNTCTDKNGTGLPQAFVNKGAHAAVGWHVDLRGSYDYLYNTHITFWKVLVGDIKGKVPGGTVGEAAKKAGETYRSLLDKLQGYQWYDYVGVAGNAAEKLY